MDPAPIPEEEVRRAWARALRHPELPVEGHDDARVVALPGEVVAQLTVDERDGGRFARVSVRRARGPRLEHDQAIPIVARLFLYGRFEPFPVECVVGADGETLHYVIDLEAYKESRAAREVTRARDALPREVAPVDPDELELLAIQLACPLGLLATAWDLDKVRRRDPRTITYLSDRFLVPARWIAFQVEHFLAELADGVIDERGLPVS